MQGAASQGIFAQSDLENLKRRSLRGGAVVIVAQALKFVLQAGSVATLARLLSPADFGLQSMVLALTGVLGLFRDAGLSVATVQRDVITHEQTSTLFWINTGVGFLLAAVAAAMAPVLVAFYREPRLLWVTIVYGLAFIFNGLAAQHQVLLVRRLKFMTVAFIEVVAIGSGVVVGIVMAVLGFGYWSLIGMGVGGPAAAAIALWIAVPWIPGSPKRGCGIRSILNFGGMASAQSVVDYAGNNTEKFLLGRFWGAEVLGLYSRAYQLANVPLRQLSASLFNVVFPALSRIQGDIERLCRFFLKSYSLLASICIPITVACALFAEDIIPIFLGPKWTASIPIFRILSPTIMAFALLSPIGWFLLSTGRAWRSLQISFFTAPAMILGVIAGLRYGPRGVAAGYSISMTLLIIPVIAWSIRGTGMKGIAVWRALQAPILSGVAALAAGILFTLSASAGMNSITRLVLGLSLTFGVYVAVLLFVVRQFDFYRDLVKELVCRG